MAGRSWQNLVKDADIFLQGFRPGALAARGFGPEDVAALRPGIVYVSLSAYGEAGPWASRRGFDSLVQTATGFNAAEAHAAGVEGPKELPCQALDHASGYLLAFGAIMARIRQAQRRRELAGARVARGDRTLDLEFGPGLRDGFSCPLPSRDDVADLMETSQSPFGVMRGVRHAAQLSETPAAWTRPSVPLGTHPPVWPSARESRPGRNSIGAPCGVRSQARSQASRVRASVCGSATPLSATMTFERGEPVPVIGLAGIGIAGRLRFLDFVAERRRPFTPGE